MAAYVTIKKIISAIRILRNVSPRENLPATLTDIWTIGHECVLKEVKTQ